MSQATASNAREVVLTGIKPTGMPHLGNYLGAIRPAIAASKDPKLQSIYFIADYHAITGVQDPVKLREATYQVAATWISLGLDTEQSILYRQSDVPQVCELSWLLSCLTSKGWMNKAHAYKARVAENMKEDDAEPDAGINMGLYTYPILMAADILLFDTKRVPVGRDQVQHVEISRDIASRFNHVYGETLSLPEPQLASEMAVIPGLDGRKMSKSYDNTIPLFLAEKPLRKLIMRIVTDSTPPEVAKNPADSSIFQLYEALASSEETAKLAERYATGIGWGEAKQALFERLEVQFAEARTRFDALMADTSQIDEILAVGAKRAQKRAQETILRVRRAVGIEA